MKRLLDGLGNPQNSQYDYPFGKRIFESMTGLNPLALFVVIATHVYMHQHASYVFQKRSVAKGIPTILSSNPSAWIEG